MNTNIYDREEYTYLVRPLGSDDDKESCFRFLTNIQNETLCQGIYDATYINIAIENSSYVILRHRYQKHNEIVAFALVKLLRRKKKNKLDVLLVCTIPNKERLGNMIAYDIYGFAHKQNCDEIYTEPRTSELRKTFMKYGFESLRGIENVNEVLVKEVKVQTLQKANKTRKSARKPNNIYLNNYNLATIE